MPVTHGVTSSSLVRTANVISHKANLIGALVQLVRIHACHAWGHEFESRTHRRKLQSFDWSFFVFCHLMETCGARQVAALQKRGSPGCLYNADC